MLALSILMATSLAGAAIACPAVVNDTQSIERPPGAESVRYWRGPRELEYMSAFLGHPRDRRSIQPIESEDRFYTWEFTPSQDIWIECGYRNSAAVVTFHVGSTRKCTFTKSPGGLEPSVGGCEAPAP